ncbi:MAG TPA: SDR family NAD(P)-dependent oxidoreductase [Quisquiliibacterium sp.]|nr:SDR family NAD(P)-dependent oxidoreductase [Quisquiliibacterium sp.]
MTLASFPRGFRVLVIGASGAIGSAFVQALTDDAGCGRVDALHRRSAPPIDFDREASVAQAAEAMAAHGPYHLIVVASGVLHTPAFAPEKRLADLDYARLEQTFRVNAFGPALAIARFAPLLDRHRSVLAVLSAKVGSIEDNRLGGWYAYRASKAALNMMLKTAAIEVRRSNPGAALVALHPGTVTSALSRPFRGAERGRPPADAVRDLLLVIDRITAQDTGSFVAYDGQRLPW